MDGLYERSSKLGTHPYNDERFWEDTNHLYEEIEYYKKSFNSLILKSSLVDKIENGGIEHTGDDECYCVDCIIKERINRIVNDDVIKSISGNSYNQIYVSNKPYIVKRKQMYYNVVTTRNSILNKEVPVTDFIDTLY